jgi:arylsulfatase A-like enzyme
MLIGIGLAVALPLAAWAVERPDILLLMPDQMRGDCLSALGHPAVRTPQLDALARDGALFRRAYSTVASCIPARYALLTGLSPQTSGVVGFAAKPIRTPTLPGALAQAGYATALVGRYMHQPPASGDCGYQTQVLGSTHVDDDDYDRFLKQAAPDSGGIHALARTLGLSYNHWQAKPWPLADELHPTAWIVSRARKLVGAADAARPLFLTASFYAPHPPLFPPKRIYNEVAKRSLPATARGGWVDWAALMPGGDKGGHRVLLEGEALRAAQAGYFGLIEHLDEQVAPLIAEFKARSERAGRPWLIAVTSDHGEMLGDHGYFRKCEPYEGAANIPFIVCGSPALGFKAGVRVSQPVCLEDLMPTLLSLAGAARPPLLDGRDLTPSLRGEQQAIREWLHIEHAPCYGPAQAYHALTDGRFKYIWRPLDGQEQLFDLAADPREEQDLAKQAGAAQEALARWRARLVGRLASRPEGFVKDGRLVPGRTYKALNTCEPRTEEGGQRK